MIYNNYGATGIKVSAIGFGGMRFKDQADTEGCAALVKYAHDKGITFFDTAAGYGRSEELFGLAFREMRKHRQKRPFFVSTKSSESSPAGVRRDVETSLKRLGLDAIDFYHVWCILSKASYDRRKTGGAFKEFEALKREGLIKHICVSTHMTGGEIEEMLADYPFEGLLVGYSAMNFAYRGRGLTAAAERNLGVAVMNPLGGGMIPRHPRRFEFVKTRPDETVVQGALRFLFNDQRISTTLVGFSGTHEIDEALAALDGFKPIPQAEIRRMRENIKTSFNELCTGCGYCDNCAFGVPVPKLMEAFNHRLLSGDPVAAINRLRMHWGIKADDAVLRQCTECGKCEEACTQKLPIRERIALLRETADRAKS